MKQTTAEQTSEDYLDTILAGFTDTMLDDADINERENAFEEGRDARDVSDHEVDVAAIIEPAINRIPIKLWVHFVKVWDAEYKYTPHAAAYLIGYNMFMECIGTGVGFWDRDLEGDKDYKLVKLISELMDLSYTCEFYIGDDGKVYRFGHE